MSFTCHKSEKAFDAIIVEENTEFIFFYLNKHTQKSRNYDNFLMSIYVILSTTLATKQRSPKYLLKSIFFFIFLKSFECENKLRRE